MTREEEAFIEGHEHALDNRLDGITEEDIREYERLIEKRRQEESRWQKNVAHVSLDAKHLEWTYASTY